MNRFFRPTTWLLLAGILGIWGVAGAQSVPVVTQKTPELPPELQALLDAVQPVWTASASLHAAAGYKDNLLLSRADMANSGFARGGVEALLWHVPRGKIDYFGFLNADYTRYFKRTADQLGHVVDHEAQSFAGVEWRFRQPDWLGVTLDAQGYYLDQVFDVSDSSVTRSIEALKVNGLKLGPTVRWTVWHHVWLEGNAMAEWQKFADGYNDARIHDVVTRLGWTANDRIELSVGGTDTRRHYDHRPPVGKGGTLPGLLAIDEQQLEGRADITWGARRRWTTHTRGGLTHYTDNAAGYLNYREPYAAQEVEWSDARWLIHAEAEWRYKRYEQQTVGSGLPPLPAVTKNEITALLRVERKLSERWTIYAEIDEDRARSNDIIASYRAKEGLLGARWSWEK